LVDEKFHQRKDLVANVKSGLMDFQRGAVATMAKTVISSEAATARELSSPMLPDKCEWSFGFDDENFLRVKADGVRAAKIKGRIDRIDVADAGKAFLVIDYKTGKVEAVKNDILNGIKLQLPLYVAAVKKFLYPDAIPVGGFLLSTKTAEKVHGFAASKYKNVYFNCGTKRSTVGEEDFNKLMAAAETFAAKYASSISEGVFGTGPQKKCKDYCKYSYACRFSKKSAE
jgi:ATP-dependent helicase/DNAse subunit B